MQEGEAWSADIVPKVNSPELNYYRVSDPSAKNRMNVELLDIFGKSAAQVGMPQLQAFSDRWRSEFFFNEGSGGGVVQ